MLKIIGGKFKTRVIDTPNSDTLPSKNMVREAISSALRDKIVDADVLDLFSGSGAVGIEFISRGAKYCLFNDVSKEAYSIIQNNLNKLQIKGMGVSNLDYLSALERNKSMLFDIVFLDPPYKLKESYQNSIKYILDNHMLKEDGVIVIEYEGEVEVDEAAFSSIRDYKYGKTKIKILWR